MPVRHVLACFVVLSGACGSAGNDGVHDLCEKEICSDLDGDGFGVGCACLGADCDDSNPAVADEGDCSALCAAEPTSTGCACDSTEEAACYFGPDGTLDVGTCRSGLHACVDGRWSACQNQVTPSDEACNWLDDDCDGETDEEVLGRCGECSESGCTCAGVDCEEGPLVLNGEPGLVLEDGCIRLADGVESGSFRLVFTQPDASWQGIYIAPRDNVGLRSFSVRYGETRQELDAAAWIPIGTAPPEVWDLTLPYSKAALVEVQVDLARDATGAPSLCRLVAVTGHADT